MTDLHSGKRKTPEIQETRANQDQAGQRKSLDRILWQDKENAAKLREKGPDILTGNECRSQIYRGQLDSLHKGQPLERLLFSRDSRGTIVMKMCKEFYTTINELLKFSEENKGKVFESLGYDYIRFMRQLQLHMDIFYKYKNDALEAPSTRMKNQAFDRMLVHLDILQRYKWQMTEWKKSSKPSEVRLDENSLDKVYTSLEDNYEALLEAYQRKEKFHGREKESNQEIEEYSRNWYRAFLIINDETSKNIEKLFNKISTKKSGEFQKENQSLLNRYSLAIKRYNTYIKYLEIIVEKCEINLWFMMHEKKDYFVYKHDLSIKSNPNNSLPYKEYTYETTIYKRDNVINASNFLAEESRQVIKLGAEISKLMEEGASSPPKSLQ